MKDINAAIYKSLKAKSLNKRKAVYDFDRNMEALAEEITPRQQRETSSQSNDDDAESREEAYNAKIAALQKEQEQKLAASTNASNSQIEDMEDRFQKSQQKNYEISDSLRAAIEKIAAGQQGGSEETQQTGSDQGDTQTPEADENALSPAELASANTYTDYGAESPEVTDASPVEKESETVAETAKTTSTITAPAATTSIVKKALKQGEGFKVGNNIYQITNLFGPRTGANAVPGREGQHSNGIDIVGYSPDKKVKNLPVALTDGVIQSITLQGNGKVISPTQGAAGGYIMNVKMPDGKIMKYMHLGKDVFLNKANLLGKTIKRGDILYEGDYSKGSGSQTGPHIKVSVTSVDGTGKELKDYSNPANDPTIYALYGKYIQQEDSAPTDISS
jgi:hypothetical protein